MIDLEANRFDDAAAHISAGYRVIRSRARRLQRAVRCWPRAPALKSSVVTAPGRAQPRHSSPCCAHDGHPGLSILLGTVRSRRAGSTTCHWPIPCSFRRARVVPLSDAECCPTCGPGGARTGRRAVARPPDRAAHRRCACFELRPRIRRSGDRPQPRYRNTVKTHLSIYGKLNVRSRGEAAERAHVIGLIGRR